MDVFCRNVVGSEYCAQATFHFDDIPSRSLQLRTDLSSVMLFGGDFFPVRVQSFNLLQRIIELDVSIINHMVGVINSSLNVPFWADDRPLRVIKLCTASFDFIYALNEAACNSRFQIVVLVL